MALTLGCIGEEDTALAGVETVHNHVHVGGCVHLRRSHICQHTSAYVSIHIRGCVHLRRSHLGIDFGQVQHALLCSILICVFSSYQSTPTIERIDTRQKRQSTGSKGDCINTYMYLCMHACIYVYTHTHTHTHTHRHTYIHMYIHRSQKAATLRSLTAFLRATSSAKRFSSRMRFSSASLFSRASSSRWRSSAR